MVTGKWGSQTKFGFCPASKSWVPRDEMLSVNIKIYSANNDEHRIPIRVSAVEHEKLVEYLETLRWDNELRTYEELQKEGATPCEPVPMFQSEA